MTADVPGSGSSISGAKRRLLVRLHDRKARAREGLVLVEGPRAVETALEAGARVRFAFVAEHATTEQLAERLAEAGAEVIGVPAAELALAAGTETPQGPVAVAEEPRQPLPPATAEELGQPLPPATADEPRRPSPPAAPEPGRTGASAPSTGPELVLLLDAVQDPGNVGALLRSAAALGFRRAVALDGTADPWSPKAVRSSAGLVFRIPVHRSDAPAALDWLEARRLPLLVADARGADVRTASLPVGPGGGRVLVVGNETAGPRSLVLDRADSVVSLPLAPRVDSLNAAVAGSILMWILGPGTGRSGSSPE